MLSCSDQPDPHAQLIGGGGYSKYLVAQGQWLGKLNNNRNKKIPFNFEVKKDSIFIINSEERIGARISIYKDSLRVKIPTTSLSCTRTQVFL